jgi:DNA-directed RNA polymerase specialized sigma24 family protein
MTELHDSWKKSERSNFDSTVHELRQPENESGRLLRSAITKNLQSFHLDRRYSADDVLNEAYLRGINKIDQGEHFRLIPAWLKKTSYNIVREWEREQKRSLPLDENLVENSPNPVLSGLLEEDLAAVRRLMRDLRPIERTILNLKVVANLPWKEVRLRLIEEGFGEYSEESLRQRKGRILASLRVKIHELNSSS